MKFSEYFNIEVDKSDDWFDMLLNIDTKLFIDPFLIYANETREFIGSHEQIISFFNNVFELVAKSKKDERSLSWKKSLSLLLFPEAEEFKLGYAGKDLHGAGAGRGFAKIIAGALWEAISAGVTELTHFEEVGIMREGIGADRISDITATILKSRFVEYTNRIAKRKGIPTKEIVYRRGLYNPELQVWTELRCELPINPTNGRPILLAPKKYIRDLPTISADDFWNYCYDNENEMLRTDFSVDITRNVDKKTIVEFAKNHPELRSQYLSEVEQEDAEPYNLREDKRGLVNWYEESARYCQENPLRITFENREQFSKAIDEMLEQFRNYVENNGGWHLLWNDDGRPKSEEAAQFLMQGIIMHWCKASNIDISREVNIGRGPVDFKVSQGYDFRALMELKLAKNTKFWSGLSKQLPKYQEAENIELGYFVIVLQSENDLKRLPLIKERVGEVNKVTGYFIKHIVIDAMASPPSASKL